MSKTGLGEEGYLSVIGLEMGLGCVHPKPILSYKTNVLLVITNTVVVQ